MAALFRPWTNTALGVGLAALVTSVAAAIAAPMIYVRTPYNTGELTPLDQPVVFDHRHHVQDDEIGCLYCHSGAESSALAGVPSTDVCMGCHGQVWSSSPLLEPVRRSYFANQPIPWNRVHRLPDFVFFDHSVHVRRGVGCGLCHGAVDGMAVVYKAQPLTMNWCLDCHRNPPEYVKEHRGTMPRGTLWGAGPDAFEDLRPPPGRERAITSLTTCSACHR
jgi:predicted CXXCH cytochrome family protein